MSLIVSSLTDFASNNGPKLFQAALWKNSLTSICKPYQATGAAFDIPLISSTPVIQAGGTCGTDKSGTTTITNVQVSLCKCLVAGDWCVNGLKDKYTAQYITPDMNETESLGQMSEDIFTSVIDKVAVKVEKGLWGNETEINVTLGCNGIKQLIENTAYSASVTTVNFTGVTEALSGATTASNVMARVDELVAAYSIDSTSMPSTLFVTPTVYKYFLSALKTLNLYHYKPEEVLTGMEIPGSMGIYIRPQVGLTDNKKWYLTWDQNIAPVFNKLGADSEISVEKGLGRKLDYYMEWKQGVEILYPTQLVYGVQP